MSMSEPTRYTVKISRRGPLSRPFGWEICQQNDGIEVERSTNTFATYSEALADSAAAAAPLLSATQSTGHDQASAARHGRTLLARLVDLMTKRHVRLKGARPAT